jgi:hypothetical protein
VRTEAISADEAPALRKRTLIVDAIGTDFRPDTHVALGPWCFQRAEGVFPGWDQLEFVDPFPTSDERRRADLATCALANQVLDQLWPGFNARHGVQFSRRFWHIVAMYWLCHLIQFTWRVHEHVRLFVSRHQNELFDVRLVQGGPRFSFSGGSEFIHACFLPSEFRSWIVSELTRRLAPPHWTVSIARRVAPLRSASVPAVARRRRSFERVSGFGRLERGISLYVDMLPCKPCRPRVPATSTSPNCFPASFLALVDELVESTLPASLDGDFHKLLAEARRQTYCANRMRVTTIDASDDQENIVLACAAEAGERLIAVQHGGVYGWAAFMSTYGETEFYHDAFLTWGWTAQEDYDGRFVPVSSARLGRHLKRWKKSDGTIVFVGRSMDAIWPRIDFFPPAIEYRRWKRHFLSALDPEIFTQLRYRPYLAQETLEDAVWLRRFFPTLKIVEGHLDPVMHASRLLVVDHPVTTFATALAANIPTVGFWDHDAWPLARQAEPVFEELKRAGIIFHDPKRAAASINETWSDVEGWWADPDRQRARELFCERYARTSRWWLFDWLRVLRTL